MARWDSARDRRGIIHRIKRRMRVKDWTQTDLAEAIGIARSTVSIDLDENSDVWFSAEFLIRLPLVLDCTADWLFFDRGPETSPLAGANAAGLDGYLRACDDFRVFLEDREMAARKSRA